MSSVRRILLPLGLLGSVFFLDARASAAGWPQLGRDFTRNAVSPEKDPLIHWQIEEREDGKVVRPALEGSYEAVFHEIGYRRFLLDLTMEGAVQRALETPRLERAIGVVYRPETERLSHYFHAVLPRQFDAVLHYDTTRAVEPMERTGTWERGELPETYPSAL